MTCRDWFQLTLKEGLTVYRDQEFSADMGSKAGGLKSFAWCCLASSVVFVCLGGLHTIPLNRSITSFEFSGTKESTYGGLECQLARCFRQSM